MTNRTFIILCLQGALLSFNVAAAAALIPSIANSFAVSEVFAGKIIWLYMLPYGIAALFYGPLARIFCVKKIELICLGLFSLANLVAGVSQNITTLFVARFFMGLFGASVTPLVLILITNHSNYDNRGKLIGVFFSATFIASLLGLFLSGFLFWRLIFIIPAIIGLILWFIIYFYLPTFSKIKAPFAGNYLAALRNKKVLGVFTYILLISLFFHGIQQWLAVYFSLHFNFSQFIISMLVTLTSLSGIFGEIFGGWLADHRGRYLTIESGIILMLISSFLLQFKTPVFILAVIMTLWGLGWAINHAGLSTLLTDLPKEFINEAASLNSSVRFIAGGLGAALGGVLIKISFFTNFIFFTLGLFFLAVSSKKLLQQPDIKM